MPADERRRADDSASLGVRVESVLMAVLLLGIIVLAGTQIVLRNFFSFSLLWADGLIRVAVLWLAVIGAVAASRSGRHIAIRIVPQYFPSAWHRPVEILVMAFATVVSAMLAWQMARFVFDTYRYGDLAFAGLPAWPFQIVMPIGFACMSYHFLRHTIRSAKGRA